MNTPNSALIYWAGAQAVPTPIYRYPLNSYLPLGMSATQETDDESVPRK